VDVEGGNEHEYDDVTLPDPVDLETWFDDVGAPTKILDFLTSDAFPLSASFAGAGGRSVGAVSHASVLDLGTGNGSSLLTLRLQGSYHGYMVGVDYSPQSIELARKLSKQYSNPRCTSELSIELPDAEYACDKMFFEVLDLLEDDPRKQRWWPSAAESSSPESDGFDLVLDKGTFDAISLSSDTIDIGGKIVRVHEAFPRIVISLIRPRGFFLITSCNWTEEEVVRWFTTGEGVAGELEVFDEISYHVFEFGGHKGQGVASVCFRRRAPDSSGMSMA
jgi:SAM-dependent methyltransferase